MTARTRRLRLARCGAAAMACLVMDAVLAAAGGTDWRLVDERDGIVVEQRAVDASPVLEVRASGRTAVPPAAVLETVWNHREYVDFVPYLTRLDVLAEGAGWLLVYEQVAMPLATDRDYTILLWHTELSRAPRFEVRFESAAAEGPPENEDYVRVRTIEGSWLIEPHPDGGTHAAVRALARVSDAEVDGAELRSTALRSIRGASAAAPTVSTRENGNAIHLVFLPAAMEEEAACHGVVALGTDAVEPPRPPCTSPADAVVLHTRRIRNTFDGMKTLTVRLPTPLVAEIEAESRARRMSKSDVVRERLRHAARRANRPASDPLAAIADLLGAVDGLPPDLSRHTKRHLRRSGYGQKRPR